MVLISTLGKNPPRSGRQEQTPIQLTTKKTKMTKKSQKGIKLQRYLIVVCNNNDGKTYGDDQPGETWGVVIRKFIELRKQLKNHAVGTVVTAVIPKGWKLVKDDH